jgi:hypothetical protein
MTSKLRRLELDELAHPLTWLIIANTAAEIVSIIFIFGSFNPILMMLDMALAACAMGLLLRAQWAFYGFLGASFFNLIFARAVFQSTLGLAGVLALYAVQYKQTNRRWPRLS